MLGARFKAFAAGLGLTPSQQRFTNAFFAGNSICLTGCAGTGKSYIIRALFDFLSEHRVSVGRTASTGVASFNIGGQTIHSFAGLGLGDEHVESIIEKLRKNPKARARIKAVDVLFIDEISMIKGDLLNKLDLVMKYYRRNAAPFGGVKLVVSGDFLQLPGVFKGDEVPELAFQSRAWREAGIQVVVLKEVIRQQGDNTLLRVLNDIRVGDTGSLHLLDSRVDAIFTDSDIEPVRIFCKNVDVAEYNKTRLARIPGQPRTYLARDSGQPHHTEAFNKNCPAPEALELKVGAQVLLVANLDTENGYVNGSVGVVRAFGPQGVTVQFKQGPMIVDRNEWQIKEQEVGADGKIKYKVVATRNQIPLKVCYAVTVHRVQGMTLDRAIIDMSDAFATGQSYTALSRVRDLESLSIVGGLPHSSIKVNRDCVRFYEEVGVRDGKGL